MTFDIIFHVILVAVVEFDEAIER